MDKNNNPILFYDKKNQIFLLEHGPQVFMANQDLKNDINDFNSTNHIMRKCKKLSNEQRKRYIELGNYCQEISEQRKKDKKDNDKDNDKDSDNDSD